MSEIELELPRRKDAIRRHKERGGKVAAVLPVHPPRALLRACDILPVELWGPPAIDASLGDTHLQPYTCSIVRCALGFLLSGGLEQVDFIVVPHACDSLQGLGSVLLDYLRPAQPVLPFYLPRYGGPVGRSFLTRELESLLSQLSEHTGLKPSRAELWAAVEREEQADELLAQLHAERPNLPLSDARFYEIVRCREHAPAEAFSELARQVLLRRDEGSSPPGVPVILSGIVPEPMKIFDVIAGAGGAVVADDLACCGRRLYPAGAAGSPLGRMAQSLLAGPPCSTRCSSVSSRLMHLRALAQRTGAKAVIFYVVKFCEPELFYLPQICRELERAGLSTVVIEVDIREVDVSQQTVTRIEALLETVQ